MKSPLYRILFVEDDADIQAIGKLALEAVGGFKVELCSSGKQALERAKSFAPDLILLDVMMPEMDGLSTFTALRAQPHTVQTPIVFMTAKVQAYEIARYKQMGALDVISKPFDPMTLPNTIHSIWASAAT